MRKISFVLFLLLVVPTIASAGEIFGRIIASGSPSGTTTTSAPRAACPAVKTDKSGSYHVVVEETGKCTLTVSWNKQSASLDLASYDDAVQADLVLEVKDGKLTVRRK